MSKIRNSSRSHAHKIQAAVAMEQRAREMGKTSEAAVFRKYINAMKKKTKKMNEGWSDKYKKSIDCNNPKGFSQQLSSCSDRRDTRIRGFISTIFVFLILSAFHLILISFYFLYLFYFYS